MATPENTFIQSVHRYLPVDLYRMKNHNQFNAGIPDVWYSGPAGDLWIEYKFNVIPKRDSTLVVPALSDLQRDWIRQRTHEGRKLGVIVGTKDGGVWFPGLAWEAALTTVEFRRQTRTRAELAGVIAELVY